MFGLTNVGVDTEKNRGRAYNICVILFWGSLWGIVEATVGYLLHLMPFRVPTGSILFPIGYYFMNKSYREIGELKAIFLTAFVAAFIKLVNLSMPAIPIIKVINPILCILFESLALIVIFKIRRKGEKPLRFIHPLLMSAFWRIGYYIVCFTIFIPLDWMESSSILGLRHFTEFFVINGFINSLIIYFYDKLSFRAGWGIKIKYNLLLSMIILGFAFVIQWFI